MDAVEFRTQAHKLVDWMADYLQSVETYPVRPKGEPGEVLNRLPELPPENGEEFDNIFDDFKSIVLPGMTHWQHPSFFAYFNANSSPPSVLAEMLTATLGAQCMSWATSPAATELEERMMEWLGQMIGLPPGYAGVIQDTGSTSTLCAILTAREVQTRFTVNREGLQGTNRLTAYCSTETHSSIEKGIGVAGLGRANLRKVGVDRDYAMDPGALEKAIRADRSAGHTPFLVVATLGTTGSTAIDPLNEIAEITVREGLWLHVDAALAGSALLLPEMRWMIRGIEHADSFFFNPHKWLFTNFDCSAYFVRDADALVRTLTILPEYLKTQEDQRVKNYRNWGIQLGRRFRALKLWFVIRSYGVRGLQEKIRKHIAMARDLVKQIDAAPDFELLAPTPLQTICFRYRPEHITSSEALDRLNARLLEDLNNTGRLYMSHTTLNGVYTLRMVTGQTQLEQRHVDNAWDLIQERARRLGTRTGQTV
jgi:aromatic-L-amino-acid decarboxylase